MRWLRIWVSGPFVGLAGFMPHLGCPVPVLVRTNEQKYREAYRETSRQTVIPERCENFQRVARFIKTQVCAEKAYCTGKLAVKHFHPTPSLSLPFTSNPPSLPPPPLIPQSQSPYLPQSGRIFLFPPCTSDFRATPGCCPTRKGFKAYVVIIQ
jgi:hypothetical protein